MASRLPKARATAGLLGPQLAPRHKIWLTWKGTFLMGPNYLRFLDAVEEHGTILEAGHVVGWSYRTCLNRIRRMEKVIGDVVLVTQRGGRSGGGATLSPAARRLVRLFRRWERESERLVRQAFATARQRS
jgi:molybdate transport system regulatory protein